MKLNHNTYVGKKYLYFITYNVLRGLKHLIRTHLKIELSYRAAVLRDVNDCTLAIYHYWRESDWCNWIYSARTLQILSAPADYEELAGGIKGAVSWKWEPSPKKIKTWKESINNALYKYKTRQGSTNLKKTWNRSQLWVLKNSFSKLILLFVSFYIMLGRHSFDTKLWFGNSQEIHQVP